jgi:hypothetical protein
VYSDADGDGLDDTFTVVVATTVTDTAQIAVYFAPADRLSANLDDWRILPINVVIAGGNATIAGPSWLLVVPALYESVNMQALDPNTASNFVTDVSVQQRTTYTSGTAFNDAQATLEYETRPVPWWGWVSPPTGGSTDPATVGYAVGRAGMRDAKLGIVTPVKEVYDATTGAWSADYPLYQWEPDRVTVRYLAGYPLTATQQIDTTMVQLVCRLAAAEMARDIPALLGVNREMYRWQFDLARSGGANDESYALAPDDLTNPFGTRRGHVWAWRTVKRLFTAGAVII